MLSVFFNANVKYKFEPIKKINYFILFSAKKRDIVTVSNQQPSERIFYFN
ncbi:hypothetical protein M2451_000999 [Dysgonomonas sp. PFB1-18]|nr:hypothetical protein [Dysgonomonas sp. PF1-14]MDH6338185.1 hypothetical protein [Dysgonomonas sp. PF1-16]MDH6379682.1 hypothetical protein [Dysgonomonas sp. PFB1-18]MDH6397229.1 hypothetical protein [Dysgonomonas sp. PF1-23]